MSVKRQWLQHMWINNFLEWKLHTYLYITALVEPDICKTYAHAIDLLSWTMFQLCYVHYCLCSNYVTYHIT